MPAYRKYALTLQNPRAYTCKIYLSSEEISLFLEQHPKSAQPRTQITSTAAREWREASKLPVCSFNPPTIKPTRGALRARRALDSPMADGRSGRKTSARTRARFTVIDPQASWMQDITRAVSANPTVAVRMLKRMTIPRQLEAKISLLGVAVSL